MKIITPRRAAPLALFAVFAAFALSPGLALAAPLQGKTTPAALLDGYAQEVKAKDSSFGGFSAQRGEALFRGKFTASADTPSCTTCHTESPKQAGKTRAGKAIDPLAPSANPARFTESDKVEKWFGRNCESVLGRPCTPLEKGDFITFIIGR
ncbi:MAG: DUF1924 domain-containing protein [Magnetococcales bacterium]|nr:DUF1924 domain-containing protein [Magnetococcales bacterium]